MTTNLPNELDIAMLQKDLDKRFGCSWHVVVGEEFGFEITHEVGTKQL